MFLAVHKNCESGAGVEQRTFNLFALEMPLNRNVSAATVAALSSAYRD
jgi:hypothetical protein